MEPQLNRACGIVFRESATSKLITLGPGWGAPFSANWNWAITRWTNDTTYSNVAFQPLAAPEIFVFYARLEVSGPNLNFYFSHDGVNYIKTWSETLTNFFTTAPDQWGYSADCQGNNGQNSDCKNTLLSWTTQ